MNLPLISGTGDKEFLEAVDKAIAKARTFKTCIVKVSVGFDMYYKDKLLGLQISLKGYYECALRLRRAFPEIFAVLEGGYHNEIKDCVERFIDGIHKGALPPTPKEDTDMSIGYMGVSDRRSISHFPSKGKKISQIA